MHRHYSVKDILKLEKRRFRDEEGVFVLEGKKLIAEAVQAKVDILQFLATEKFGREQKAFFAEVGILPDKVTYISEHNIQRLSGTQTPSGIMAIAQKHLATLDVIKQTQKVVVFENIRDPGNLGTMIRTADWFGINGIMVSQEGVDIYNDKVLRATMGSLFHMPIYVSHSVIDDLQALKDAGFAVVVTRPESPTTFPQNTQQKFVIVMGNESRGTSKEIDELADFTYSIPKYGHAESLNVAVSFGIALSQLVKTS